MRRKLVRAAVLVSLLVAVALIAMTSAPKGAQAGFDYAEDEGTFAWGDACEGGDILKTLADVDDDYQPNLAIGFTFPFAGSDYTMLEATSNGVISLNQENNDEYDNEAIPTAFWEGAALFAWWDDLDTEYSGQVCVKTVGSEPNRAFVVTWDDIASHNLDETTSISFEAVLCEGSGNVVFQYLDTVFGDPTNKGGEDEGGSASVGIQSSGTSGLQHSNGDPVLFDEQAIVYYPTGVSPVNCLAPPPEPTPTATPEEQPTPIGPTVVPQGELTLDAEAETVVAGGDTDVTATVVDENGDPVAGEECTFEIKSQPGDDASVDAGPITTDAEGKATTTLNAGDTPGTVEVEATCGALSQVLGVTVTAAALPQSGAGDSDGGIVSPWLILALGALAGLGAAGALTLSARRR